MLSLIKANCWGEHSSGKRALALLPKNSRCEGNLNCAKTIKNYYYYTFKLHFCFLLVDIHQLILDVRKPWHHSPRISWIIRRSCPKKKITGRWWRNHLKAAKMTKQQKWRAAVWKVNRTSLFTANLFLHLSLLWMYNKTIIWFVLGIISRIIQTSVNVIRLSLRLITLTSAMDWPGRKRNLKRNIKAQLYFAGL